MKKRNIAILTVAILLLSVGAAWALRTYWSNQQLEKVCRMQDEMLASGRPPQKEASDRFQEEMNRLSPSQREEVGRRFMDQGRRQMEKAIDDYFELPKEKRNEYLDKKIKEFDEGMKRMASAGPPKGQGNSAPSPQNPAPPAKADSGPRQKPTQEQMQLGRNGYLGHTSPERRAKGTAFFAAIIERRRQLGLPAFPTFPGPPKR